MPPQRGDERERVRVGTLTRLRIPARISTRTTASCPALPTTPGSPQPGGRTPISASEGLGGFFDEGPDNDDTCRTLSSEKRERRCDDRASSPEDFHELLKKLADAHESALAAAVSRQASPTPTPPSLLSERSETTARSFGPNSASCPTLLQLASQKDELAREESQDLQGLPSDGQQARPWQQPQVKAKQVHKVLDVWDQDPVCESLSTPRCPNTLGPGPRIVEAHVYALATKTSSLSNQSVSNTSCAQRLFVHPSSPKRQVWDAVSLALLAYDTVQIPFVIAFAPPASVFLMAMSYTTFIFWTLDMFASMLTGYYDGKDVIMEPATICWRYLRTWFPLDAVLVLLDWILFPPWTLEEGEGSAARLGRSVRVLRFMRTLRLIRILKVSRILEDIQDQINTEAVSICYRVLKIVLFLVFANHVVACSWYSIGSSGTDEGEDGLPSEGGLSTWVIANNIEKRSLGYKYVTSLHWSLTQFTPASMEIVPQNVPERLFAVIVLLFAMVSFSSFVSILTASVAQLRNISSDEMQQFWLLRRYLRDWHVSRRFAVRLQRYLEYAYHKQRQRVQAKDVKLLALLSGPLHDQLKAQTLSTTLVTHPLFRSTGKYLHIFSRSLSERYLGSGDVAFYCGERGSSMLIVCCGVFSYQLGELVSGGESGRWVGGYTQHVTEGQWVAEAPLWTKWLYLGDLQAVTEATTITIDAQRFGEALQVFRPSWVTFREYARRFVIAMNAIEEEDLTDLLHTLISSNTLVEASHIGKNCSMSRSEITTDQSIFKFTRSDRFTAWRERIFGRKDQEDSFELGPYRENVENCER